MSRHFRYSANSGVVACALWLAGWTLLGNVAPLPIEAKPGKMPPGEKIVGPTECRNCHKADGTAWANSKHATSFKTVYKSPQAKEILGKLELRSMKRGGECTGCHFTATIEKGSDKAKVKWGVSCESCHGPAHDWVAIHSNFGPNVKTAAEEAAAHREERLRSSEELGMIRPVIDNIYQLATNCFECHTVPNEKLVNTGGHTAGSAFELVSWSQGEVRHNFAASTNTVNAEASAETKRIMYVVGRAVDLEHGLRGYTSATTDDGDYAQAMSKRVAASIERLQEINAARATDEVTSILAAVEDLSLTVADKDGVNAAIAKVAHGAQQFVTAHAGNAGALAPIDALIPNETKGQPYTP